MCDFKPGDEVVCYRHLSDAGVAEGMPPIGHVDTILIVGQAADGGPEWGLRLVGHRAPRDWAMNVRCFRKVQRRDLTAWLSTAARADPTLPSPPRPARRRERESA